MEQISLNMKTGDLVELVWQSAQLAGDVFSAAEGGVSQTTLVHVASGTACTWSSVAIALPVKARKPFVWALTERAETSGLDLSNLRHYPKPTEYHIICSDRLRLTQFLFELMFVLICSFYQADRSNPDIPPVPENPFRL